MEVEVQTTARPRAEAATAGDVPASGGPAPEENGARIFLTLGEQDGASEATVREAVQALAPGLEILGVAMRRSHSFLNVKPEALDGAVAALDAKEWNGKRLGAERARRRRPSTTRR